MDHIEAIEAALAVADKYADAVHRHRQHATYETQHDLIVFRDGIRGALQPLLARLREAEADARRWRTFLNTRPASTHEVIRDAIDAATKEAP